MTSGVPTATLSGSDQAFLLLYGTGINTEQTELRLGNGRAFSAIYTGQSGFAGVQQMTFRIPNADVWRSEVGAFVRVYPSAGGFYDSQGVTLR